MKIVWNEDLSYGDKMTFISLRKPLEVLTRVYDAKRDELILARSATPAELKAVHHEVYVDRVLAGEEPTGFGYSGPGVLKQILAANGVMIEAVRRALATPGVPIMAPVSGFHHAHYVKGGGYCTFNGLLAAVVAAGIGERRVLIIDGDGHYGDGTDDILSHPELPLSGVRNLTSFSGRDWHRRISEALAQPWDLIVYQAGADAYIDDPYGAGYLTRDEWDERDTMIFTHAARSATPIVWNLAGGYGPDTVDLHVATAGAAHAAERAKFGWDLAAASKLEVVEQLAPGAAPADDVVDDGGLAQS